MQKEEERTKKTCDFHRILRLMRRIVNNHSDDTININEARWLHHFFHKDNYIYNPLERLFYSEDIFRQHGIYEFIKILNKMSEKGVKKKTGKPLTKTQKNKIARESRQLIRLIDRFKENPNPKSEYIQDRIMAKLLFKNKY